MPSVTEQSELTWCVGPGVGEGTLTRMESNSIEVPEVLLCKWSYLTTKLLGPRAISGRGLFLMYVFLTFFLSLFQCVCFNPSKPTLCLLFYGGLPHVNLH